MSVQRLAVNRDPTGYLTAEGQLVLQNAGYTTVIACVGCGRTTPCGWYTGHGQPIRWYCDGCAGRPCNCPPWALFEPGAPKPEPVEILAPQRFQLEVTMKFWMVYVDGNRPPEFKHATRSGAEKEAERLARLTYGKKIFVLEAMGHVEATEVRWQRYPVTDLPF